ncbi:NTPase [Pseudomonas sp. hsmgli-8]|uniref:NTPase n=2 Tax=Pseudomonas TaxID=286 RepID=A0ABX0YH85_9PSED|nr:KAP family NTPase [Pseudomonas sp. LY10J]NJP01582.1 NTPase [Pseudomonas quercus]
MGKFDHIARQDRAIEHPDADALERGPFISSLVRTLVHTELNPEGGVVSRRATGFVVGLTGEWGLGKSSVLNLLGSQLKQMDQVVVTTLNPWLFKGRDELVRAYFDSLREALGKSPNEKVRAVQTYLERYKASIEFVGTTTAGIIDALMGGGAASVFWKKWLIKLVRTVLKPKDLTPIHERKFLEAKLADAKVAVVVLIDELDRVEDEEVRAVAQLVKAVGDIKGISYLVAYDSDRVTQALGRGSTPEERRATGESYLEKIVQFPIPLRPLFEDDAKALLANAMQHNGIELPSPPLPYQLEVYEELIRVVRTPREIKRMVGAYSVLEKIVRGEICSYDLLAYSWLVTKAPSLRQRIADRLQKLVDDPGTPEMVRRAECRRDRGEISESLSELLGATDENQETLLKLLFPRFGGEQNLSAAADRGNRVAKRRNLIRLLYLGNPPGMMSKADVEKIWACEEVDESFALLELLRADSKLDQLFDRIGDALSLLPSSGDSVFWVALSKTLVRQYDWILSQEETAGLVDDACAILWRFAQTSTGTTARFRSIVQSLIASSDLLLVPWILRKHLFAHGLTHYPKQSHSQIIFDFNETIDLRDRELKRYAKAVSSGMVLRRLPDNEAIFCLLNSDQWDTRLRASLTAQLTDMNSVGTLAALLNPPNVIIDLKTLDRLVDANQVVEVIERLVRAEGLPENPWLASSLIRFRDSLLGRDPHFSHHEDGLRELKDMVPSTGSPS